MSKKTEEKIAYSEIRDQWTKEGKTGSYVKEFRNTPKRYTKADLERFKKLAEDNKKELAEDNKKEKRVGFRPLIGVVLGAGHKRRNYDTKIHFDTGVIESQFVPLSGNSKQNYKYQPWHENSEYYKLRVFVDEKATKELNSSNEEIIKVVYDSSLDNGTKVSEEVLDKFMYKSSQLEKFMKKVGGQTIYDPETFYQLTISDYCKNSVTRLDNDDNEEYVLDLYSKTFDENGYNVLGVTKEQIASLKESLKNDKIKGGMCHFSKVLSNLYTGNLTTNSFSRERFQTYKRTLDEDGNPIKVEQIGEAMERVFASTNGVNRYRINKDNKIQKQFDDSTNVTNRLVRLVTFDNSREPSFDAMVDLFGFSIDFDGVDKQQIDNIIKAIELGFILRPTTITNSGNGLHFHYALNKPISAGKGTFGYCGDYKHDKKNIVYIAQSMSNIMYALCMVPNILVKADEKVKKLNITQGYRAPGALTKAGMVTPAFFLNKHYDIQELVEWASKEIKRLSNICKKLESEYNNDVEKAFFTEPFDGTVQTQEEMREYVNLAVEHELIDKCFLDNKKDKKASRIIEDFDLLTDTKRLKMLNFSSYKFIMDNIERIPLKDRDYIIPYNIYTVPIIKVENSNRLRDGNNALEKHIKENPDKFNKKIEPYVMKERDKYCELRKDQILRLFIDAQLEFKCIKRGRRRIAFTTIAKILKRARYTKEESLEIMNKILEDGNYNSEDVIGKNAVEENFFKASEIETILKNYSDPSFDRYSEEILRKHFSDEAWKKYGYEFSAMSGEYKQKAEQEYRKTDEYKQELERRKQEKQEEERKRKERIAKQYGEKASILSDKMIKRIEKTYKKCSIINLKSYEDEVGNIDIDKAIKNCIVLSPIQKVNNYTKLSGAGKTLSGYTLNAFFGSPEKFNQYKAQSIVKSCIYAYKKFNIARLSRDQQQLYVNKILFKLLNNGKTMEYLNDSESRSSEKKAFIQILNEGFAKEGFDGSASLFLGNTFSKNFFRALDNSVSLYKNSYIDNYKKIFNIFIDKKFKNLDELADFIKNGISYSMLRNEKNSWYHSPSIKFIEARIEEIHNSVNVLDSSDFYNIIAIKNCNEYSKKDKELLFDLINIRNQASVYSNNVNWIYNMYRNTVENIYGLDSKETIENLSESILNEYVKGILPENASKLEFTKAISIEREKMDKIGRDKYIIKHLKNVYKDTSNEEIFNNIDDKFDLRNGSVKTAPIKAYCIDHCQKFSIDNYNSILPKKDTIKPVKDEIGNILGDELQLNAFLCSSINAVTNSHGSTSYIWNKIQKDILDDEISELISDSGRNMMRCKGSNNPYEAKLILAKIKYEVIDKFNPNDYHYWNELSPAEVVEQHQESIKQAYIYRDLVVAQLKKAGYNENMINIILDFTDKSLTQFEEDTTKLSLAFDNLESIVSKNKDNNNTLSGIIKKRRNKYLKALVQLNINQEHIFDSRGDPVT